MPDPGVVRFLRGRKAALLNQEQEMMRSMAQDWLKVERSLQAEMEALAALMKEQNVVTSATVMKHDRFQKLMYQARAQAATFNEKADARITVAQAEMSQQGIEDALKALQLSYKDAGVQIVPQFNQLPVRALEMMFGYASDGSALAGLLARNYPDAVNGLLDALVAGMAKGSHPTEIAREMRNGFGVGLSKALTIARTEVLRSYRMGSFEQYRNSGVVVGYKRMAAHDARVCPGCLFKDGEMIDSLDGEFDEHPNGRCTAVPVIIDLEPPTWQSGIEWFGEQSETMQREILGAARFEAWQKGASLQDMSKLVSDPQWGGSYVATPVHELTGSE